MRDAGDEMELSRPVELEVKNRHGETVKVEAKKVRQTWEGIEFSSFNKKVSIEGGTLGAYTIEDYEGLQLLQRQGISNEEIRRLIEGDG